MEYIDKLIGLASQSQHSEAIMIGLLVSWALTYFFKKHKSCAGAVKPALFCACVSMLATVTVDSSSNGFTFSAFWLGLANGLAAPAVYQALVFLVKRRIKANE